MYAGVCYANIKQVCFWTTWDLNKILDYTDVYFRFDEFPSTFSMGDKNMKW